MEQVQNATFGEAGAQSPALSQESIVLERAHDEVDILEGCPRTLLIGGLQVTHKAFTNRKYHNIQGILLLFGFESCETEEEIDKLTLDDIYQNCVVGGCMYGNQIGFNTFDDFLYSLIQWPENFPSPGFENITMQEFRAFLSHIIEQNNLLPIARKMAKKNLRLGIRDRLLFPESNP